MYKEEQKIMRMTMPSTNMSMKMERKKEQKDENEENVKPLLQVGFCFLWWRKSSHFYHEVLIPHAKPIWTLQVDIKNMWKTARKVFNCFAVHFKNTFIVLKVL